jgi:hypothetical protein
MGEKMNVSTILEGKPEGGTPLGRPSHKSVYIIKMDLRETGWVVQTGLFWLRIGTSGGLL